LKLSDSALAHFLKKTRHSQVSDNSLNLIHLPNLPKQVNMTFNFNATRLQASRLLGISIETVKKWEYKAKIPAHCYTKFGYKTVRYCLPLLQEWQLNPDDIEVQTRSAAALAASMPSNQPTKAGRKAAV
jgi:hypothetical protein